MKVICTYTDGNDGFTVGKVYEVVCDNGRDVDVIDDNGERSYLLEDEFEVLEQEND